MILIIVAKRAPNNGSEAWQTNNDVCMSFLRMSRTANLIIEIGSEPDLGRIIKNRVDPLTESTSQKATVGYMVDHLPDLL